MSIIFDCWICNFINLRFWSILELLWLTQEPFLSHYRIFGQLWLGWVRSHILRNINITIDKTNLSFLGLLKVISFWLLYVLNLHIPGSCVFFFLAVYRRCTWSYLCSPWVSIAATPTIFLISQGSIMAVYTERVIQGLWHGEGFMSIGLLVCCRISKGCQTSSVSVQWYCSLI